MSETLAHIPAQAPVRNGVVAYLSVDGALAAADFYAKAFGAQVLARVPPDEKGRTMHVHLLVNGTSVMLGDFYPEHGHAKVTPQGFSLVIDARDIEAQYRRAVEAGCTPMTPPQKMFWGDTFGAVKDPFGVTWGFNQPA